VKKSENGAALIMVTSVMAIVTAICFALLLASYQMYATVNDEIFQEEAYRQALSFSEVLRNNLTKNEDKTSYSIEGFITEFMSNDRDYPAELKPITVTFDAEAPDKDTYPVKLEMKKEQIGTENDELSTNGWEDGVEYYFYITVSTLDNEKKALSKVSSRYRFAYSAESYTYNCLDDDSIVCMPDPNDKDYLLVGEDKVLISTLKNSNGRYKYNGENITIERVANAAANDYSFEFLGFY